MKQFYLTIFSLLLTVAAFAQTTIDISQLDAAYTTTFEGELVIDVAETSSAIANPNVFIDNPFAGQDFTEAEISFDVYNYFPTDSIKVLGTLVSMFDPALGRMYFSNGSYLGFNVGAESWFDANMNNFALDTDFLGSMQWKNVKLQFTTEGYAVYVDDELAFDQNSTDVTINGPLMDYSLVIDFLQNADIFAIGTGSFWSDNTRPDGTYFDPQYSYMKNITLTANFSTSTNEPEKAQQLGKLIGVDFYNMNGRKLGTDEKLLEPGVYIRVERYDSGQIKSTKFYKSNQ